MIAPHFFHQRISCRAILTAFLHTFLILPVLLCFGCLRQPEPPVRVGTNVWIGYEPFYLARDKMFFSATDVKLVEYTSATEVMRSFRNGAIDAAALTLDETLQLAESGMDLRVVLVIDISNGADVVLARQGITSLRQLKNKRVGLESTALGAYMMTRALQYAGMRPSDVTVISLDEAEHERAFNEGRVDAVVTFEPVRSKLIAAGARILFDSSKIPGEVVDVLVVNGRFAGVSDPRVRRILIGWFRALDYLREHPADAARKMAIRENTDADRFLASLKGLVLPGIEENVSLLSGTSTPLKKSALHLERVMRNQRLLFGTINTEHLFDDSFVRDLQR